MTQQYKTVGILGGGQLGQMSAIAAKKLGIKTHIYCPEKNCPASHVADKTTTASYEDQDALKRFAEDVDVITYEFENIPVSTVQYLKHTKPVYPDETLLNVSQHRGSEKSFLNKSGLSTAAWNVVTDPKMLNDTINDMVGIEFILKTTRFGYDGKGQARFSAGDDSVLKWKELNTDEIIIEQAIDFDYEISVIIARDQFGKTALYGPSLNEHKNGILHKSIVPTPIPEEIKNTALSMTEKLAVAINLRGVLAVEYFITKDGRVLANEIAPRTHNSGHWTMDACAISQFENHIRTVCGLDVGSADAHSPAIMINLIGDDILDEAKWNAMDNAIFHSYGKEEIKPGRKMGHVNIINPTDEQIDNL